MWFYPPAPSPAGPEKGDVHDGPDGLMIYDGAQWQKARLENFGGVDVVAVPDVPAVPKAPACDCGALKAKTTHARYCTVYVP